MQQPLPEASMRAPTQETQCLRQRSTRLYYSMGSYGSYHSRMDRPCVRRKRRPRVGGDESCRKSLKMKSSKMRCCVVSATRSTTMDSSVSQHPLAQLWPLKSSFLSRQHYRNRKTSCRCQQKSLDLIFVRSRLRNYGGQHDQLAKFW